MSSAFKFSLDPSGIGELKFDLENEKVNKFSLPVLKDLEEAIDSIAINPSIKALKFTSGKSGIFIAGADLHAFEPIFKDPTKASGIIETGHRIFDKIAALPFPTIAVIDGACLGGGCEFALSCTYRIVTDNPKTLIGLPEVNLGIYPGWGGTQRLPRLIGLSEGLNMILAGKVIPAFKAWKLHLADALIPAEFQEEKINEFIAEILTKNGANKVLSKRKAKPIMQWLLDDNPLGRAIVFNQAEKNLLEKTKGHYPAPVIALKLIKETYNMPLAQGLKKEIDTFVANIPDGFAQAENLIALFFTQEALKKETGTKNEVRGKTIKSAAVIGAGTMGAGIAWLTSSQGIFTRLKDVSWDFIGKGLKAIMAQYKKGLKAKKITPSAADLAFQRVSGSIDYSGFQHAELVIEAATENLELKRKIFAEMESAVTKETILASNTSSLSIDVMAETLQNPERFIGMHFFNPVPKMPLVEVVRGSKTNDETVATVMDLCRKLGKTPILVGDCPGFLVNRIFLAGANEMMLMLEEGYSVEDLNKAALDFGMPLGPLVLADEVGVDVTSKVAEVFEKAYGERMRPAKILHLMVEKGFLGKKCGKGFNIYKADSSAPNPAVPSLLQSVGRMRSDLPKEEILPRFLNQMINEAARCLDEKIVERADYLDMALIMGIGFPPFRGGLLRYADTLGTKNIVAALEDFQNKYGPRFTPCEYLKKMALENRKFISL